MEETYEKVKERLYIGRYAFLANLTMRQAKNKITVKDRDALSEWVDNKIKTDYPQLKSAV